MSPKLFVNLPVKDLPRAVAFFSALGYTFNEQFTDENATCMIISDSIAVMLLVEPFFANFTRKPIVDAMGGTEAILALTCESRAEVDDMIRKATAAGAATPLPPQDHGFMYQHGFQDLDGHLWEYFYMEPGAAPHEKA